MTDLDDNVEASFYVVQSLAQARLRSCGSKLVIRCARWGALTTTVHWPSLFKADGALTVLGKNVKFQPPVMGVGSLCK